MGKLISAVNQVIWGAPALLLIIGVGLFFGIRLGFVQLRFLPRAFSLLAAKMRPGEGDGSFRALCTALGATVGTGNLVGVAGAICLGGPGAVFWMWICGTLGMAIKYAEVVLAVRFQVREGEEYLAGPMYVMERGLGSRFRILAKVYCLFGMIAALGVGNAVQINTVVTALQQLWESAAGKVPLMLAPATGLVLALVLGPVLLGGARRIGAGTELLVPLAAGGYILMCLGVLVLKRDRIPEALISIVRGAFSPRAVTGGCLGSAFQVLRVGCSRGVFTNEAGMGTASIAHGAARVQYPAEQGLMGIVEVFLDTIVICTLTALTILTSGVPVPYGVDMGGKLTMEAFQACLGSGSCVWLTAMLCAFAMATVLGWSLYGLRCTRFLLGNRAGKGFGLVQTGVIFLAAVVDAGPVWQFSELINGLMVIPNLFCLILLASEVRNETLIYQRRLAIDNP